MLHDSSFFQFSSFFIRFLTTGDSYSNCLAGDNLVKFWIKDPNITAYQDISQRECAYVFGDRIEKNTCDIRYKKRFNALISKE